MHDDILLPRYSQYSIPRDTAHSSSGRPCLGVPRRNWCCRYRRNAWLRWMRWWWPMDSAACWAIPLACSLLAWQSSATCTRRTAYMTSALTRVTWKMRRMQLAVRWKRSTRNAARSVWELTGERSPGAVRVELNVIRFVVFPSRPMSITVTQLYACVLAVVIVMMPSMTKQCWWRRCLWRRYIICATFD